MDMFKKYNNYCARNARGAGFITARVRYYKKHCNVSHETAYIYAKEDWAMMKAGEKFLREEKAHERI